MACGTVMQRTHADDLGKERVARWCRGGHMQRDFARRRKRRGGLAVEGAAGCKNREWLFGCLVKLDDEAWCGVPWHTDVACEELQSLNEDERGRDDLLLRDLAGQKKWNRCPRYKLYVEKTEGSLHITCRCRFEFCYACGEPWTTTHGGCQRN
ncbi:hypothetical protein S83_029787 [Arachis hypogaea]